KRRRWPVSPAQRARARSRSVSPTAGAAAPATSSASAHPDRTTRSLHLIPGLPDATRACIPFGIPPAALQGPSRRATPARSPRTGRRHVRSGRTRTPAARRHHRLAALVLVALACALGAPRLRGPSYDAHEAPYLAAPPAAVAAR